MSIFKRSMPGPGVPEWCRPGAPVVMTAGADDSAVADATAEWKAGTVAEVTDDAVTVKVTPPYTGTATFRPVGLDARPQHTERKGVYLAPADAPDVADQRRRRDAAKHPGTGRSDWVLTDEGWRLR